MNDQANQSHQDSVGKAWGFEEGGQQREEGSAVEVSAAKIDPTSN